MSYLEDFQMQINNRDFTKFLQLWEEYCNGDIVEAEEFILLLKAIKNSDFAKLFGQLAETALPLWKTITNEEESYQVLKHILDLQSTNTQLLADTALQALKKRYNESPEFSDRLRLVGLRSCDNFQGALSNYDLLYHGEKGNYVFHTSGWGTGEIVDLSPVREQFLLEFENVSGRKHITFATAFKTLIPLKNDSFLARRFADADKLEMEAKENPIGIIKLLLKDLGPKTASEIKDELCELVIPEKDWAKWWQGARAKLKKDSMIEAPTTMKGVFRLRKVELTAEQHLQHTINKTEGLDEAILSSYNFLRDLTATLKKEEIQTPIKNKLLSLLELPEINDSQRIQILILLNTYFDHPAAALKAIISEAKDLEKLISGIDIIALKKKALTLIKEIRKDWAIKFVSLLNTIQQGTLRDYLIKELNQPETKKLLLEALDKLRLNPVTNPDLFVWYFQKLLSKENPDLPFSDKEGKSQLFESFLILFNAMDSKPAYKDLVKKMYNILSGKRYAVVRAILEGTTLEFVKEFLLLISKCQAFTDHDLKILRSLAAVVHPSISTEKSTRGRENPNIIWTTEAGYLKTQDKAQHIGTIEVVENAREVEAARALGDLRENSEYKFAIEKRARLQGELKMLTEQLNRARIITRDDISREEIGIGNVVELHDKNNHSITYTILGPWDADPDAGILSSQSKLAEAMIGLRVGDTFQFRNDEYTIAKLKSYLDK